MKINPLAPTLLLLAAFAAPAFAQDGKSTQSLSASQSSEVVEDLGEIEQVRPVKFRANIGASGSYTSNALLSGNHGSGDFLFFPSVEGGLNAKLGKGFTFDFAAKVETVLYARFDERAFAGYSATTTLDWRPKPNLPRIYIGAEPYRYDRYDTGDLITQAVGLTAGTDWGFGFNGGNSLAVIGYSFTSYYSDPGIDNRDSHRAIAAITHQLRPQLYGQVLYGYQYTDYEDVDRRDSRHIAAVNLTYQLNRHLFTTLTGSFVDNDSTQNRASYQSAGAVLSANWQF